MAQFDLIQITKKEVHGDGMLCEVCDLYFDTTEDVRRHQEMEHLGAQYRCTLCSVK